MKNVFFLILFSAFVYSCSDEDDKGNKVYTSEVNFLRSEVEFESLLNGKNDVGDPYTIRVFQIEGDSAILYVTYSGGCEQHSFNLVWNGKHQGFPPEVDFVLLHNSNDDDCTERINERLAFSVKNIIDSLSMVTIQIHKPGVQEIANAFLYERPGFSLPVIQETAECSVHVTALNMPCDTGARILFVLPDSSTFDNKEYFKHYLVPTNLVDYPDFDFQAGAKYLLGVSLEYSMEPPTENFPVCSEILFRNLVYSVRIRCVTRD